MNSALDIAFAEGVVASLPHVEAVRQIVQTGEAISTTSSSFGLIRFPPKRVPPLPAASAICVAQAGQKADPGLAAAGNLTNVG